MIAKLGYWMAFISTTRPKRLRAWLLANPRKSFWIHIVANTAVIAGFVYQTRRQEREMQKIFGYIPDTWYKSGDYTCVAHKTFLCEVCALADGSEVRAREEV